MVAKLKTNIIIRFTIEKFNKIEFINNKNQIKIKLKLFQFHVVIILN